MVIPCLSYFREVLTLVISAHERYRLWRFNVKPPLEFEDEDNYALVNLGSMLDDTNFEKVLKTLHQRESTGLEDIGEDDTIEGMMAP